MMGKSARGKTKKVDRVFAKKGCFWGFVPQKKEVGTDKVLTQHIQYIKWKNGCQRIEDDGTANLCFARKKMSDFVQFSVLKTTTRCAILQSERVIPMYR